MPDINIALIGYKFMGKAHSNAFRQVSHFFPGKLTPRLKVICGRDRKAAEAAARQFGWEEVETDWRRVIERKDIDVVDISTPGHLHYPMAIAAAEAGKHIICEKALANSLAEAKEMLRAVERGRVKHLLMHNYRKIPAVAYARQLVDEGRIGRVYHYRAAYLQDWIMDPDFPLVWRLDKKLAGSGVLGDLGSHIIDLARYLNSDITSVTASMTTFIKARPKLGSGEGAWGAKGRGSKGKVTVDDAVIFLAKFENASVGTFEASRFCGGRRNFNCFEIYGSKGSLAFNLEKMNELQFYDRADKQPLQAFKTINVTEASHPYAGAWWPPGHILGYEHTFVHAVHDFLTAIEKDTVASPNFQDGVYELAVMEAIEKSAKTQRWEKVKG
jgi:predicted dehydrogenase